jgi:two-component system heavy metal sensor histidine kinase CusS
VKSIGSRLALWYSVAATGTLLCLCVAGYYLLQIQLVKGLDLLNRAQFEQIKAHLGPNYAGLNAQLIEARIRETTNYASVLFFITVDDRIGPVRPVFYSTNLRGAPIPDVPGKHVYDAVIPGFGELRVAEFILGPLDVTIGTPLSGVREALREYILTCAWLLALMVAISVAIGLVLSHLALRPVRLIRITATHISSDNLSERIPVAEVRDEISDLAQLLNQMFDRLESAFNQIRRFTAEASHELKTPLSLIRLQAEKLLMHGNLGPVNEESVHVQLEELSRLSQIIEELLFLSRAESHEIKLNLTAHEPEELLATFNQDAHVLAEHRGVHYFVTYQGSGSVLVEPRWLRRVLLNILTNALNVAPRASAVTLHSEVEQGVWRVSLSDQGPGVAPELREKIFDRFFRIAATDEAENPGSGLGLAICRSIVSLHGGKIWAEQTGTGAGLRIIFELPIAAEQRASRSGL